MGKLKLLVIGAHPDDCEFNAGGLAALYLKEGHNVKFVSVTDGSAGHHEMSRNELRIVRKKETENVTKLSGVEYKILDNLDGELEPTHNNKLKIIKVIREYKPSLILTHRPNDYHPDHRYTSQLVLDSAYCVMVPLICPEVPALRYNPLMAYVADTFSKPYPFSPGVIVDIESVFNQKIEMLACHQSQVFDWIPWVSGQKDQVPSDPIARKQWLIDFSFFGNRWVNDAKMYPKLIEKYYGAEKLGKIIHAEAFELGEYGAKFSEEDIQKLFFFK